MGIFVTLRNGPIDTGCGCWLYNRKSSGPVPFLMRHIAGITILEPVDLIHVSAGTYQKTFGITHPSMFTKHGRNVFLAAEIKKHVGKPVATIGGLNDPAQMEEIIASGKADGRRFHAAGAA